MPQKHFIPQQLQSDLAIIEVARRKPAATKVISK
jgi:hypothetical protein